MNSKQADLDQAAIDAGVRVAGGAVDQYLAGTISLAFLLGGTEPGAGGDEDDPAPREEEEGEGRGGRRRRRGGRR